MNPEPSAEPPAPDPQPAQPPARDPEPEQPPARDPGPPPNWPGEPPPTIDDPPLPGEPAKDPGMLTQTTSRAGLRDEKSRPIHLGIFAPLPQRRHGSSVLLRLGAARPLRLSRRLAPLDGIDSRRLSTRVFSR
jgi:hypothetical protein